MRIKTQFEVPASGDKTATIYKRLESIWALRSEIAKAHAQFTQALRTQGTLSPRLRELVRLRIGFHNQCRTCMAVRYEQDSISEDTVCSLERPAEAPDLTAAERAALAYADLFATNHLKIDDAVHDNLRKHFTEGEVVELGITCASFVGFGRLAATWDITEELPDDYKVTGKGPITPWGHEQVLTGLRARSDMPPARTVVNQ